MTLQKATDIFAILLDKFGSPNLITSEVIDLLNMALSGEYMNRLFPDNEGSKINWEQDENVTANIQPLIWNITATMNGSGILADSTINTALQTATGNVNDTYFRIGSIAIDISGNKYPVQYIKQNNRWAYETNYFKKPNLTNARYTWIANGIQFYPTDNTKTLTINLVKKPKLFATADLANACELGDYTMFNVIAIALQLAGVSIRDSELIQEMTGNSLDITK